MISVKKVAEWFLSQRSMEHKVLQKLCYYAQAWHCALEGRPLFSERIEAWVHGPVIPVLYQQYKSYGWQKIPKVKDFNESIFSLGTLEVLRAVYDTYGDLTGMQLENLTHSEAPWQKARGELYPSKPLDVCTNEIQEQDMREYYQKLYERSQDD